MNSEAPNDLSVFTLALEITDPAERAAYVDRACGADTVLRNKLFSLLKAHENAGTFDRFGGSAELTIDGAPREFAPGTLIGRYKLLEKIGEGGMGVVYLAEQSEPVRRRVALKIIKLGMDTRNVVARFEAERQALAMMDHPNIAKVLDGGATDTGRPYFVMELVQGIPITEFCQLNSLSLSDRLRLFIHICDAVQHAHQKGIIHRDLKPSNILVTKPTGVPTPKIIDFGVAKAIQDRLTSHTVVTELTQLIGTPAYMSPEQAGLSGLDIDTRTDIYALGVLLYELLTGTTPFPEQRLRSASYAEMQRIIAEEEPERPSTRLRKTAYTSSAIPLATRHSSLATDLDWIVLKCLEKDRARRYETAKGLASDIQRHLDNEAVLARPPSTAYRFQKTVQRNKLAFAAAIAVATVLALGVVMSTWQAIRATREQARARQVSYGAETSLAFAALELDNLGRARELLSKQQARIERSESGADPRGWEWRHLYHQTRGDEHTVLTGHEDMVAGVSFLNDGRTIASGGWDHTLRLWDLEKRTNTLTIPLSKGGSRFLCLSPDGHWLAVGGESWQLFDTGSWRPVRTEKTPGGASALAFSGDSQRLALIAGSEVRVLDVASRELLASFDRGTMQWERSEKIGLAFSPDGEWLAYGDAEGIIRLSKFADRAELLLRPAQATHSLAFTRDGRHLISGGRGGIDVWNTVTGIPVHHLLGHRDEVAQVTVSRDGSLLASASVDQTVRLWDTTSWKEIRAFRGHYMDVVSVGFSPDGKHLVSAGRDEKLRVWNVEKLPVDNDRFVSPDNAAFHWPFAPGHRIALVHGNLHYAPGHFELSNSRKIADALRRLGDRGAITYLDCITLEESAPELTPPSFSSAQLMVFGRDARSMAVGWPDGRIELWATQPFRRLSAIGQSTNAPLHLVLSENGQRLAVHRADHTAEVWNPVTGTLELRLPPLANVHGGPNFEFWAQDSILAINVTRGIDLRFLPEGRLRVFPHPKVDVWFHAISNDGRWLATSSWDGLLRLWDVQREQPVEPVEIVTGQRIVYYSLVFSPDDSRLIGGGYDGTITIWDMATRQQVAHWKAHDRECAWLRFVGPNQDLISAGNLNSLDRYQGEIRRWRAPSLAEIDAQSGARSAVLPTSLRQ